ncbi:hypothetical protein [Nocardia nova]|uniref:hypothetical protein n=1 Tax=Nocardia nova TaxID=37330 RepID=UPI00189423F2|nr:hypothetical protein [Nocardia nova]MBF6278060.1 hypothetical protein [Nocardia nova]
MHAFVDETKQNGLLVVSTVVEVRHLKETRKQLRERRVRGQNRIHFKKESDPRRRSICSALCDLEVTVAVYDATRIRNPLDARAACLTAAVEDLADLGARRLTIEQDDSLVTSDRKVLYQAVRKFGVADTLAYEHMRPNDEPLLWVSDAVAWCVAKGGDWRNRVNPIITSVRKLA